MTPVEISRDTTTYSLNGGGQLEVVLAAYHGPSINPYTSGGCFTYCEAQYENAAGVHYKRYSSLASITGLTISQFLAACDGIKPDKHPSIPA